MNQAIKALKYENLIFVDLEMASQYKDLRKNERMLETFQYKKRDKVTGELPSIDDACMIYDREAVLNPLYGKIVSATLGIIHKEKIRLTSFKGEEKSIVKNLVDTLVKSSKRAIVGVNSNGFDLPYLRKRHNILGMGDYPEFLNDVGKKPWEQPFLDIMTLFKGSGFITDGLDEMCMAYGIPSPKHTGVKGSEVNKAFWDGKIDEIVTYCEADVFSTINLFRKMRGEELAELEQTK